MFKKYLLMAFVCVSTLISAQKDEGYFYGQLVNTAQNEPVAFASIRIKDQPLGVISNQDGTFKIPSRYTYLGEIVEISCMGFQTKEIPISDFIVGQANIITLIASPFQLTEAVVSANIKKLSARQIVRIAVNSIPQNYPLNAFGAIGYYRDYQIHNGDYSNLNEAILKTYDKGFSTKDNFDNEYQLLSFRRNPEFKIDSFAQQPYNYSIQNKIIPSAKMENLGNEFITLSVHDAIRNHQIKTYSFINDISSEFVENHRFKMIGTTNYKDEAVYEITSQFRNRDYFSEGRIFIGKEDFAILKIDYSVFKRKKPGQFDTAINPEERFSNGFRETNQELIYRIITEYARGDQQKMFLNYISFYNKILVQRPPKFKSRFILDLREKRILIYLNRVPAKVERIDKNDFKIAYKDREIRLKRVRFFEDERRFRITPDFMDVESAPALDYLFTKNEALEVSDLSYAYGDIRDSIGNKLDE